EDAVLFDEVRPNPDIELIAIAKSAYVEAGCDGLIALGGGSSMDTAKSVGVEVVHGGSIVEYEYGGTPITTRIPPLVAVPTTAGTGSEGAAHAMSQSAGGVHECPHGALTARVLGPVCEYNAPADPERYARVAQGLGVDVHGLSPLEAALAGVEEVYRLTDDVGIPSMEELGFSEDEIPMLARIAYEDPQTIGNPREVDAAGYEEIYRNSFARGKR